MDLNKLIERAKAILVSPKTQWPVIAQEPTSIADLYKGYIIILAAIPAVAGFIKGSIIGTTVWFAGTVRTGIVSGLSSMVLSYVLSLIGVYIVMLIVDALAPNFGGQKDKTQALKVVAYSMTAAWIAGIAVILPGVGLLLAIAGGIYSIYLLYLGLPHTMKAPPEKAGGYTAVTIVVAIVVNVVVAAIVSMFAGIGSSGASYNSADVTIDGDSPLGRLEQWSKDVEAANEDYERAQRSGDQDAQADALAQMMGAAIGGGNVEALSAERLQAFLPDKLTGLPRTDVAVERNAAMGLQISEARATYADEDGEQSIDVEIVDTAAARGLLALAGFTGVEGESERNGIREKIHRDDGRLIREYWNESTSSGEYAVVLADRFTVKVHGNVDDFDDLEDAMDDLDLDALEKLKNEGVRK